MLHVIFIILKIIGIVLGVLLALFLFLVGIILFVPVRYRVYASKYDTIQVKARVSWLLRIVSLRFRYYSEEETYWYCLRIFGFTLIDSNRPTKVKKVKKEKVKKTKLNKHKDKKTKVKKTKKVIASDKVLGIDDQIDSKDKTIEDNDIVYDEIEEDKKDIIKPLQNEHTNIVRNIEEAEEEREGFFSRITKPIKTIFQRIKDIFIKIREGLQAIRNIFSNIKAKIHLIKEFLAIEDNRKGIGRVYAGLKKTLKHILPYKVKGVVRIGLDDPCSTGYLLGALSMAYPIYADKIQIIPDFQEEVLEGQVDAKGRIRAFTLLIIGIKLILNDNFKTLLKNVKELKEEL
nr:DUF2953 domain-containing protein [uncultured Anaerosporobacter sp.]